MKRVISVILNVFIAVMVPVAWLQMMFSHGGLLSSSGWASLKYFTVLSNILMGAASLVLLIYIIRGKSLPLWAERLKFAATVAVALTFITVVTFLGPVFGYGGMFLGANFWFHLIIPLAAIADFTFFRRAEGLAMKDTLIAVIPMLAYALFYVGNIIVNGRGEYPNTNDWYGFVLWGYGVAAVIFAVILLVTWGMAVGLRAINRAVNREKLTL